MHELSVAQEIFSLVLNHVEERRLKSVLNVKVKIGRLSNVLHDSLLFCFDAVKAGTKLENASLVIVESPVMVLCQGCNSTTEIEPPRFICGACGCINVKMISGTELLLHQIELNDNEKE